MLGPQQAETAAHGKHGRPEGERSRNHDDHADGDGDPHGLEVGQVGEAQAKRGPGDSQTRTQDDGGGPAKSGVVGPIAVFTGTQRLLITADEEDPIVGSGCDSQHREDIGGEGREPENIVIPQSRDHSPR